MAAWRRCQNAASGSVSLNAAGDHRRPAWLKEDRGHGYHPGDLSKDVCIGQARCVVEGVKKNKLGLVRLLAEGKAFDPARPDPFDRFRLPPGATEAGGKPDGD
jgi:hypothetical protein